MQVQVDIEFDELLKIVKTLPVAKMKQLKAEIEKNALTDQPKPDLEDILLNGPVATKKELEVIEKNRKAINQWRAK